MEDNMKQNWTLDELIDNWILLPAEQALVNRYKTDANKLGVALLLKHFQIAGRFPHRRRDVPQSGVAFVARQLQVSDAIFAEYDWRGRTIKSHRAAIRGFLGFREGTVADAETISDWLVAEILPIEATLDGLTAAVYDHYRRLRIEPPTSGRVERLVRSAQRRFSEQFCTTIAAELTSEAREELDRLLEREADNDGRLVGYSSFAHLKRDAGAVSLKSILAEIDKLQRIRQVALPGTLFAKVPPHVIQLYRHRVTGERPSEIKRHAADLRHTLLAAFCHLRGQEITDNLIELFISIIKRIGTKTEKTVNRKLLQEVRRIRGKGRLLCEIAKASVDRPEGIISDVIYPVADEGTLKQIIKEHETADTYNVALKQTARRSYARHYRQMVPPLFRVLAFRSDNEALQPLLRAIELIQHYVDMTCTYYHDEDDVPLADVVSAAWLGEVVNVSKSGKQRINRISYEMCVFQTLREQLRCRAVWVVGANRYRNPDDDLPADFNNKRELYYEALQQPQDAQIFTNQLRRAMADALTELNDGLPDNAWLTLETSRKHPIKLSPLPAQAGPPNLDALKRDIQQRWPMTALLDMLKEADLRTNFTEKFQSSAARENLETMTLRKRVLLCLYALGTNTGYQRMGHEATSEALRHIRRRYITKQNLREAIGAVVNAIFDARLPHIWGEATTACASDSKKFAAWDQNLLTEWHVRYRGPGIMVYWHIDKRAACIHSQVKRCSSSEVAAMIEGVLHHCTEMAVDKNYVDTHGQSSVAFAFCHLLGFQLLPRLKPISRQKLHRPDKVDEGAFANLKPILTRPIRWELIEQHYDEMIRYATALRLGTAESEAILQRFTKHGVQHPTYKALVELGKAVKTIFLCQYLHSLELRREIQEGLNVVENWNSANSFIFYGRSSEISTNDRQAQEISVLALHLLQVCMVYTNTLMIQRILLQPDWANRMQPEDLRALSPLIYAHVNPYGRFDLNMETRLPID
jgi:TnpA family transposase